MLYSAQTGGFYDREIHGDAVPLDAVEITAQQHADLLDGQSNGKLIVADEAGYPVLADRPPLTQDQIVARYERALDAHLDAVARSHRYDNRFTFAMRAGYPGPYRDEAIVFGTWMDTCNAQAFALLQSVLAGTADLPSIDDFIAALPNHD